MEDDNNTACKILMTKTELRKSLDFVNEERERLQEELKRKDNIINELKEYILNHYEVGNEIQNEWNDDILDKIKELENDN